jgi:hypothetical protein
VPLPAPATVMDEANATICLVAQTFQLSNAMVPGDVQLFTLSEKDRFDSSD